MVHDSPRDPVWEYVVSIPVAAVKLQHFTTTKCLVGHSHVPFLCVTGQDGPKFLEFRLDDPVPLGNERIIVNPGSVGQPRDGDPRASYAVYDSDAGTVATSGWSTTSRLLRTRWKVTSCPSTWRTGCPRVGNRDKAIYFVSSTPRLRRGSLRLIPVVDRQPREGPGHCFGSACFFAWASLRLPSRCWRCRPARRGP